MRVPQPVAGEAPLSTQVRGRPGGGYPPGGYPPWVSCPHKAEGRLSTQDVNPEKSTGWIHTLLSVHRANSLDYQPGGLSPPDRHERRCLTHSGHPSEPPAWHPQL